MTDLPDRYYELLDHIREYDRVLRVFWSPVPLSGTHQRFVTGRQELLRRLTTLLTPV